MNRSPYTFVLRNRHFMLLWLSQTLSQIAFRATIFILALLIYQQSHSNRAVAVLMIVSGIPGFFLSPFIGVFVDRWKRKLILAGANLIRALTCVGFLLLPGHFWWSMLLIFIFSVATSFFAPAESAVIPSLVKAEEILSANALFSFTAYSSMVLGALAAGPSLKLFGPKYVFIFLTALYLLSFIAVLFLPTEVGKTTWFRAKIEKLKNTLFQFKLANVFFPKTTFADDFREIVKDFQAGLRFIKNDKVVLQASAFLVVTQLSDAVLIVLSPGYAGSVLHIDVTDTSLVMMAPMVIGVALGSLLVGHFGSRFNRQKLSFRSFQIVGLTTLMLAFTKRVPLTSLNNYLPRFINKFLGIDLLAYAMLFIFFLGFFSAGVESPTNATIQERTPDEMRGRVFSVLGWLINLISAVPVIIAALIADAVGVEKVAFIVGAVVIVASFYIIKIAGSWRNDQ